MSEPDFHCSKCGKPTDSAPDPPAKAICEDCCEDHEFKYERWDREWQCIHCGAIRPYDYGID